MRTILALAVALALAACKKAPDAGGASPTSFEWSQASPDGKLELRQRREISGCQVEMASKSGGTLWTSTTCLPAPSGLVFISPAGDKLLVLDLFPSDTSSADWGKLNLIALWTKGTVSRQYTGAEVLAADRVADMRSNLSFLKGDTYDEVRASARPLEGGAKVSLDLVDGRTAVLGFEGGPLPAPPARSARTAAAEPLPPRPPPADAPREPDAKAPAKAAEPDLAADEGLYRWEDEQGQLHFSQGAQVPARFRKTAVPVNATVGVVNMEKVTVKLPSQGGPAAGGAKPAGAGAPAGGTPSPGAAPAPAAAPPAPAGGGAPGAEKGQ